ncbi:MAG TPA: MetQ/NlpA family ABC transporter substrate-binding protein [Alphaproteobacteria bacterium]|nr:MetQ/NlpA family ABC transporter substrate-binding protein [Alphaproteobacteria bacterium]
MKLLSALAFFVLSITSSIASPLKVGVTAGPHAIIMEKVKELAEADGIDIKIIEFNDFILPNVALNDKELDINSYQHQPFLDEQIKTRGYKIKSAGKTVLMPLGIYSKTLKTLADLKENSKIAIPSDPTNGGRALKLLEKEGLITLNPSTNPSILDIKDNPKKITILEIDAPQLPRTLDDVDAAVINTDWVLLGGLDPKTALAMEDKNSPYANVFAIREDEHRPEIEKLIRIYQSEPVKAFILEKFKGAILPAW